MDHFLASILSRSRTVLSALCFLIFAGIIAYIEIPKEADPEVPSPTLNVQIALEGVSPADGERLIIRPLEETFAELEGLKRITANAYRGSVSLQLEFEPWILIENANRDVRDQIDAARPKMPSEIEEPVITEINPTIYPIMTVALLGDVEERILLRHAQALKDEIQLVSGVLSVNVFGMRDEVVEIVIDPARLQSYEITTDDLSNVFQRSNRLVAAGQLDTGQGSFNVSVPGLFESIDDILNLPVKAEGDAVVKLSDVATVRRTFKDPTSIVRINGKRGVNLEIIRRTGVNVIGLNQSVRVLLERFEEQLPASVSTLVIHETSRNIMSQFNTLQNSVLLAVFLVMALIIAALGIRSGLLVGVSIPASFLIGILCLYTMGITISIVVMFGMIIAVGILVDGGIIIVEYADRKMAEGLPPSEAYVLSAQRMAWPIISSTATTIAAFFPILFWPGVVGQTLGFLPLTLICVLLGALIVALIFLPAVGGLFGRSSGEVSQSLAGLSGAARFDRTQLRGFTRTYVRYLERALNHPGKVIVATCVMLVVVGAVYSQFNNGVRFFPASEGRWGTLVIRALGNLSMEEKDRLVAEVEAQIQKDIGLDDFDSIVARSGNVEGGVDGDVIGRIKFWFKPWADRRPAAEIYPDLMRVSGTVPGVRVELERPSVSPVPGKPIQIELTSPMPGPLFDSVLHVRRGLSSIDHIFNIGDTRPLPGIEWRMDVDRGEAARFGADLVSIGNAVRLITNGVKLGTFRPDDSEDEVDILVRFPGDERSMSALQELRIRTDSGLVPIGGFISRQARQQETEILRVDRRRVLNVDAEVQVSVDDGVSVTSQLNLFKQWLTKNPLDPVVRITYRGEDEAQEESGSFLLGAMAIALFLMGAILLIQFNSFYAVLLILSSVILSTTGVLVGYLLTGQPFVIVMSGLGLIALAGIVVNNNIVLIDTFNRLLKTAPTAFDAIIQTGAQRLRPVFLTTATTCLGLVPMALTLSVDFFARDVAFGSPATLWWQQLSVTVIFGLIFSTLLTLIVTPAALMWRIRRQERRNAKVAAPLFSKASRALSGLRPSRG